jgi:ABC-type branched-subunit amino acid transport system ATPase component
MGFLKTENIFSGYGEKDILLGISLTVNPSEIVTIIGPNGAGKSTLLKTIAGLLRPHQGEIYFQGEKIHGLRPAEITRKGLCYVPQEQNIFPSLSVAENLEMGAYVFQKGWRQKYEEVFGRFPILRDRVKMRAGGLSGGERQMLAMGMALMVEPKLLLLDEPSAGLAPNLVEMVFQKIIEINREGPAIVMVEQNALESLALSHRGYVIVMGRNRMEGSGTELVNHPEIRESFLGR